MAVKGKATATYKIVPDIEGVRLKFYCDLSGMLLCTSSVYKISDDKDADSALNEAWISEGRENFNLCHKCGSWVSDLMYNADVLECVNCSPWEEIPEYCPKCGSKVSNQAVFCEKCGNRLMYGGDINVQSK